MIPSWLAIIGITFSLVFIINRLSPDERRWFNRLRRPRWLTFEWAIPFIWIFIFICISLSTYFVWESNPFTTQSWRLMAGYFLLDITILAYTPVMCKIRSLTVGTIIGGLGFIIGLTLSFFVFNVSVTAGLLLLPYLLWSPIGTYVTWEMIGINPGNA